MADARDAFYRSCRPPDRLTPSQWAQKYRELPASMSAEPGRWRNERAPYLVGIMDAVVEPGVEVIVFRKPTQVGFSEATRNLLGYWIDQDPGPCLLVMPSEQSAREAVEERVKPLLYETPNLRCHLSTRADDTKLSAIKLDSMSLYTGWAGSAQSLATRPCRYIVDDEVDKYPPFAGKEADPIRLAQKRAETYGHRARTIIGSSPTTRDGNVSVWYESCGQKRTYRVPCPHCGVYQALVWTQVKWPKALESESKTAHADRVQNQRLAAYECEHCQGQIHDGHKPKMMAKGVWADETQRVDTDGKVIGEAPRSKRIGFHLNAIYSPWVKLGKLASEFIQAQGNPVALMDFRNSRMAEPWEERVASTSVSLIREKTALSPPVGIVPAWAGGVFATVDTQKDSFYYVIRAWGTDYRSQGIAHGVCHTFDEVYRICLASSFRVEGKDNPASVYKLLIDSGGGAVNDETSRTDQVYAFAMRDPTRIHPIKGASHKMISHWTGKTLPCGARLLLLDTEEYKNRLSRYIHDKDESKWLPVADADDDYCRQMASEHLIFDRKRNRNVWAKVTSGAANHYWDCEVYQAAIADMTSVALMAPPQDAPDPNIENHQAPATTGPGGILGYKDKW